MFKLEVAPLAVALQQDQHLKLQYWLHCHLSLQLQPTWITSYSADPLILDNVDVAFKFFLPAPGPILLSRSRNTSGEVPTLAERQFAELLKVS